MFFPALTVGLLIGLSQIPTAATQPVNASNFIIKHVASDYFPHTKGDLSPFDVHVQYVGYNASTQSWLTALNPAAGASVREKAIIMTEAAYAKPFNANDPDMTEDVDTLLATIAGNATIVNTRDSSSFQLASSHAVKWASCAGIFSCLSSTACTFSLQVGKAPRSQCQPQGGSNCCISWSDYNIRVGFFSTTWTTCNSEVEAQQKLKKRSGQDASYSCEGYGSSSQGGDVCLSNRASGCT